MEPKTGPPGLLISSSDTIFTVEVTELDNLLARTIYLLTQITHRMRGHYFESNDSLNVLICPRTATQAKAVAERRAKRKKTSKAKKRVRMREILTELVKDCFRLFLNDNALW